MGEFQNVSKIINNNENATIGRKWNKLVKKTIALYNNTNLKRMIFVYYK